MYYWLLLFQLLLILLKYSFAIEDSWKFDPAAGVECLPNFHMAISYWTKFTVDTESRSAAPTLTKKDWNLREINLSTKYIFSIKSETWIFHLRFFEYNSNKCTETFSYRIVREEKITQTVADPDTISHIAPDQTNQNFNLTFGFPAGYKARGTLVTRIRNSEGTLEFLKQQILSNKYLYQLVGNPISDFSLGQIFYRDYLELDWKKAQIDYGNESYFPAKIFDNLRNGGVGVNNFQFRTPKFLHQSLDYRIPSYSILNNFLISKEKLFNFPVGGTKSLLKIEFLFKDQNSNEIKLTQKINLERTDIVILVISIEQVECTQAGNISTAPDSDKSSSSLLKQMIIVNSADEMIGIAFTAQFLDKNSLAINAVIRSTYTNTQKLLTKLSFLELTQEFDPNQFEFFYTISETHPKEEALLVQLINTYLYSGVPELNPRNSGQDLRCVWSLPSYQFTQIGAKCLNCAPGFYGDVCTDSIPANQIANCKMYYGQGICIKCDLEAGFHYSKFKKGFCRSNLDSCKQPWDYKDGEIGSTGYSCTKCEEYVQDVYNLENYPCYCGSSTFNFNLPTVCQDTCHVENCNLFNLIRH